MDMHKEFDTLYERHANELFRFCYFRMRNKETAQDIVAECFTRFLQAEAAEIEEPRAWLFRVCRNIMYDLTIKDNLQKKTIPLEAEVMDTLTNQENVEQIVFTAENSEILKQKLQEIDTNTSEIIILKTWEEMTFKEISQIVEMEESAVKKRFYRGITMLQKLVK